MYDWSLFVCNTEVEQEIPTKVVLSLTLSGHMLWELAET